MKRMLVGIFISFIFFLSVQLAEAVDLNLFGDVTFGESSKDGEVSGFSLGQLDFWATQQIDTEGKMKGFVEFVIESPGGGFVVDLERLWVEYALRSNLRFRAGRFHTALGYWNRTHHHGAHIQTSVFRPLFLDFEDGDTAILPTHVVGFMGIADLDTNLGDLKLALQMGNGSYYNGAELDPNNAGDVDESKGVAAKIVFYPSAVEGAGISFSAYVNSVNEDIGGGVLSPLVDQKVYVADISYLENNIELIFEHYTISNEDPSGTSRTSTAWYVQGGYILNDVLTPYIRYEDMEDIDPVDPYFTKLGTTEYSQMVYGARYDLDQNSSIKIEGRSLDEPAAQGGSSSSYWLQWTFGY